jgi:VanZ family protein
LRGGILREKILLVVWGLLIFGVVWGSLLPVTSPPILAIERLEINDKGLHFLTYLALAILPGLAFGNRRRAWQAAGTMFLLGVLLEAAQSFAPGRGVEPGDLLANTAGILCGVLAARPGSGGPKV